MNKQYDYIIAGAGCAGMSLLMRMVVDPFFASKKILVVDADAKQQNDRTWCFWETKPDLFESIVHHQWTKLNFYSNHYSSELSIDPYTYKMIRGLDFYNYVKTNALAAPNIEWRKASVKKLVDTTFEFIGTNDLAGVELVDGEIIYAEYVFSSILFEPIKAAADEYHFLQHFKGWEIKTVTDCFDSSKAVFMDFRVGQEQGTTFMYVLPTSANTALIEYTLFTEQLLADDDYNAALKKYIAEQLHINDFEILHEEKGVIPMTTKKFSYAKGRNIFIGIAGGQAKASSGYAFKFIQKRTAQLIEAIKKGKDLTYGKTMNDTKGHLYDAVLLHVLHFHKMPGDEIFAAIFKGNKANNVLAFLDNESSILTDLKIMSSVPTRIFLPAALKELL
ncbi:lycopene cyclase family protein [Sediminibacterium sp.]|uniref:lycopene cyclase family protein n=1 Tax=Sediminibacterium sp. TaxID=1917865 RepID=UPI00273660A1|nr:lycopene cyclase family protein [Sediminibacterium sp.]MDP3392383.1 lycopene cyclase family protein [Sediminibacterium sp.]MDP3566815.1 lycopene cyclase family protein [Sediminibacterium sp.]